VQNYQKSHTTCDCKYHIVQIIKYCKRVQLGFIAERTRELIRGIYKKEGDVEISKGHIFLNHVHLLVSASPHLSASKLAQYLKRKSFYKILQENKSLSSSF
jgi:putative transposase